MTLAKYIAATALGICGLSLVQVPQKPQQNPHVVAVLPGTGPILDASQFTSLQAALDQLPVGGGVVQLPPGEFHIQEPLRLRRGATLIIGHGPATTLVNDNTEGKPALLIEHPDGSESRNHKLNRVRLANFHLVGNKDSGHGVEARRVDELIIDDLSITQHGGDGIHMFECYEDPRICDSLITYNKQIGLRLIGCHDIVVSANQFEENDLALLCTDGFNLTMTGNNLDDHLGDGVRIENTYGSVVAGNMIEECQGWAIILDRDCYGITIGSNVIAHNGAGLDLRNAHGCSISANTFTINKQWALHVGPGSGELVISGNSFSDSYLGQGRYRRADNDRVVGGVLLESTRAINFSSNTLTGMAPKAIQVQGKLLDSITANNLFVDNPSDVGRTQELIEAPNVWSRRQEPQGE